MHRPVYRGYLADPFVLRAEDGTFLAIGTGPAPDGRQFPLVRSHDLLEWAPVGGALEPLADARLTDYWAPEIVEVDGIFHMYYSAGVGDREHRLRVARSGTAAGPYVDSGAILTPDEPFAIDPHPFRDTDGSWYLFYARDVLEGERVGTTIAVDRLLDMTTLEGRPRTLLRASQDWQLYERDREMYGRTVDWHTLEGPFVWQDDGRYWLIYSGGNWQGETYGLSFAVAAHPLGPYVETASDPALARTIENVAIGPGHASLVRGPDEAERLVFHAWDPGRSARQMWIERVHIGPDGPELGS